MNSPDFWVIFTDLDGTLLDESTYGWEDALPAIRCCRRRNIPVILVSSKSREEMETLRRRIGVSAPFVVENGGAVFFPDRAGWEIPPDSFKDRGLWKWPLGIPYDRVVQVLQEIREELGWDIKGFSEMSIDEISRRTGLDKESARLAARREHEEPFVVEMPEPVDSVALREAAERRGLSITQGGRFFHLQGKHDKGMAMDKLLSVFSRSLRGGVMSIALGDSPNDFSMLERADYPVLVRSKREFPELKKRVPRLIVTKEKGPKGWNAAVLDILKSDERRQDNVRRL